MAFSAGLHRYIKETWRGWPLFPHLFCLLFRSLPLPIYSMMDPSGIHFSLLQVTLLIWSSLPADKTQLKDHFLYLLSSFLKKSSAGFLVWLHSPLKACFISSCLLCDLKTKRAAGCRENEAHPI